MGRHFKSVNGATFSEKCCVRNMSQRFSPRVFTCWKCVLDKSRKLASLYSPLPQTV